MSITATLNSRSPTLNARSDVIVRGRARPSFYEFLITLLSVSYHDACATRSGRDAIDILASGQASPDACEWAERHLCGMANGDAAAFMLHRPSQS